MKLLFFESKIKIPVMKLPIRVTLVKTCNALILTSPIDFCSRHLVAPSVKIVIGHGEVLTHNGRTLLEKAFKERNYLN